jgi:divalent metal cation (Fe/Co/Zn/Cd) transporter
MSEVHTLQQPVATTLFAEDPSRRRKMLSAALILAILTITYNLAEGIISVILGMSDETLALFGFGVDSFVEVISGIGVLHMVVRMRRRPVEEHDRFEVTALRITGAGFILLAAGLTVGGILSIVTARVPDTTVPGMVIAAVSLVTMWVLVRYKLRVGQALSSDAIIADAHCTRACLRLSLVLLVSSGVYALTGWGFVDALGSFGIGLLALFEGREALQKARTREIACTCD